MDDFVVLGGDELEQEWRESGTHIDIITIKSLPTFCLQRNCHSLGRNVNIVFVRGANMEFLDLK